LSIETCFSILSSVALIACPLISALRTRDKRAKPGCR
jgi:hypothetical protein